MRPRSISVNASRARSGPAWVNFNCWGWLCPEAYGGMGLDALCAATVIEELYGYTKNFPVERYFRDAKLLEIGEGTSQIQKLIIAREIFGKL